MADSRHFEFLTELNNSAAGWDRFMKF